MYEPLSMAAAARAAGVTYRRVDYWCRRGLVPGQPVAGPGSGSKRLFTPEQVEFLRRLGSMPRGTDLRWALPALMLGCCPTCGSALEDDRASSAA